MKTHLNKIKLLNGRMPKSMIAISVTLLIFMGGCGPASTPCGTFDFTGTGDASITGAHIEVDFDFNPPLCSSTCNCNTICYIQCVRIIDISTGNYLSPNTDQTARMITGSSTAAFNGWAIDRVMDRNWGYYGRLDDGTFASYVTTGSNTTNAILGDTPSGWPEQSWFDAISVPVCIANGSACNNNLMGYYYWLFTVGDGPVVSDVFHEIARDWHQDVVDLCVTEWNTDAPGLGKHSFPAFSRL